MVALPERGTYRSYTEAELDRLDVSTDTMQSILFEVLRYALNQPDAVLRRTYRMPSFTPTEATHGD